MNFNVITFFLIFSCLVLKTNAATTDLSPLHPVETALSTLSSSLRPQTGSAKDNPATMGFAPTPEFDLSWSYIHFDLDAPQSRTSSPAPSGMREDPIGPSEAHDRQLLNFGFLLPLPLPFSFKTTLGISAVSLSDSLARIHILSGNEVSYLHYNDRSQRPELYTALGFRFGDHWGLGAGLYYGIAAQGDLELSVSGSDADSRSTLMLKPTLVPYFGILYQSQSALNFPQQSITSWRWFFTYRKEQKANTELHLNTSFDVSLGTIPFEATSTLTAFFDPEKWRSGLAYLTPTWSFFTGATLYRYSKYRAPVLNLQGKDISNLTSGGMRSESPAFKDSYEYILGAEKAISEHLFARAHFRWVTSSLGKNSSAFILAPAQKIIGLGLGYAFPKYRFRLDTAISWANLKEEYLSRMQSNGITRHVHTGGNVFLYAFGGHIHF